MENDLLATQNVAELQDSGKRWLEGVLGKHLQHDQQVFICVFTAGAEPTEATRRQALAAIENTMADVEKNLSEHGATDDEFDEAIDKAMEHIRRREA
jgi:hypothetical protein